MSDLAHVTSADGTVITFERTGAGHPLILVHGSGADRHRFDPLKPYLTGAFELALVDRRGRGASEDPENYDMAREAEDIIAVASSFDGPVHVMGYSYGGLCALEALKLPNSFAKVALFEPPISLEYDAGMAEIVQELDDYVAAGDLERFAEVQKRKLLGASEDAIAAMKSDKRNWATRLENAALSAREMLTIHKTYEFSAGDFIHLPPRLRFLVGTETIEFLKTAAAGAADAIPGSEIVWLPGLAHGACTDDPAAFCRHLTEFLLDDVGEPRAAV